MSSRRGSLFVMTGASGVGKDTIRRAALPHLGEIYFSISATTRPRRAGEVHGRHYLFFERDEFAGMIERGEVLEHTDYVGDH